MRPAGPETKTKNDQNFIMTEKHPLFDAISEAQDWTDMLDIQLIQIPAVKCFDTRLALREALAAKATQLKLRALQLGRPYIPAARA